MCRRSEFGVFLIELDEKDHPGRLDMCARLPIPASQGRRFEYASFQEDEILEMAPRFFHDLFVVDVARCWHKLPF